jgi:hypothetical protein
MRRSRRTQAVILKSETYHFHRLDLTRQAGFIVTVYDEDGLRLAATSPCSTPAEAFAEARKIVDNKWRDQENKLGYAANREQAMAVFEARWSDVHAKKRPASKDRPLHGRPK